MPKQMQRTVRPSDHHIVRPVDRWSESNCETHSLDDGLAADDGRREETKTPSTTPRGRIRSLVRKNRTLLDYVRSIRRIVAPFSVLNVFGVVRGYLGYLNDLRRYRKMAGAEPIRLRYVYPCLSDRLSSTPLDLNYFLQDTWAAGKIFAKRPSLHVDVGSTALLVGILAKFTRVCSVDIRPLPVRMEGLTVRIGSILEMPFPDQSLESISSLCVLEHIGLGRYGDPLDPQGTDKAAGELQRVVAPGGNLYVSVLIEPGSPVYYNSHRTFTHKEFLAKFPELELSDVCFIQNGVVWQEHEREQADFRDSVVGLYHLRRSFP